MNGYDDGNAAIFRLIREYEEHGSLVIAVDFDNTIYDFHNVNLDMSAAKLAVKTAYALGLEVFCFTANADEDLVRHVWARDLDIDSVAINKSSLDHLFKGRKPFYSLLLDDRAGLGDAINLLLTICEYIEDKKSLLPKA